MAGIREKQIRDLLSDASAEVREMPANGILSGGYAAQRQVFLLSEGLAYVYTQNEYDEPELSGVIEKGRMIPSSYLNLSPEGTFRYIHCKRRCRFIIFSGEALNKPVPGSPTGSLGLEALAERQCIEALSQHCHLLQQRNTERKLLAYFRSLEPVGTHRTRHVPLPYSDLCAYLQVERTAMMKVLARLVDWGVVERDGRSIRLID